MNKKTNKIGTLQRICQNIYRLLTEKKKLRRENKELKKLLKEAKKTNLLYQETLDEFYEYFVLLAAKGNTAQPKKQKVKASASMVPTMEEVKHTPLAEFQKYEPVMMPDEDEVAMNVEKMLTESQETIGLNNQLEDGTIIKYKDLNLKEIDELFGYSLLNPNKEIKIKVDDQKEVLLETHPDKTTSLSFYENKKHKRSVSTETKNINGIETSTYSNDDLKQLLEAFSKREEE